MPKAKASGGNKKRRKGDQQKRIRYNAENRGHKRRLADLIRHVAEHPEDLKAQDDLARIKRAFGRA